MPSLELDWSCIVTRVVLRRPAPREMIYRGGGLQLFCIVKRTVSRGDLVERIQGASNYKR